ncbi:unnamed protein product [Camellia sinensis]
MAGGGAAAKASFGVRSGVRIVVASERGTGKLSLIITAAAIILRFFDATTVETTHRLSLT